jgi:serine/threonine protein kinase
VVSSSVRRSTGALTIGSLLSGRYRIVQLMGKGGFGAVYKALDERFQGQRVVAIKELSNSQVSPGEKAQALQDFRREADLLVPLSHPNLPNINDFFEEGFHQGTAIVTWDTLRLYSMLCRL